MEFIQNNNISFAIISKDFQIKEIQDALDLMANAQYLGKSNTLIIDKECLIEDFFDLTTNFAGSILQKFSNYSVRVAIVGNIEQYFCSKPFKDFVYESNLNGHPIIFTNTIDEAIYKFSKQ